MKEETEEKEAEVPEMHNFCIFSGSSVNAANLLTCSVDSWIRTGLIHPRGTLLSTVSGLLVGLVGELGLVLDADHSLYIFASIRKGKSTSPPFSLQPLGASKGVWILQIVSLANYIAKMAPKLTKETIILVMFEDFQVIPPIPPPTFAGVHTEASSSGSSSSSTSNSNRRQQKSQKTKTASSETSGQVLLKIGFGGLLHGGKYYANMPKTAGSNQSITQYGEVIIFQPGMRVLDLPAVVAGEARSLSKNYSANDHLILRVTGEIDNLTPTTKTVTNRSLCAALGAEDAVLEPDVLQTFVVLRRDLPDAAVKCVGGSRVDSNTNKFAVVNALKLEWQKESVAKGVRLEYMLSIDIIDVSSSVLAMTLESFFLKVANSLGGDVDKEMLVLVALLYLL